MEYHINVYDVGPNHITGLYGVVRKRWDAAWLQFNRAVDREVRAQAGLDTKWGTDAQREARALAKVTPDNHMTQIKIGDTMITIEAIR